MNIRVFIDRQNKTAQITLAGNPTVSDVLTALSINPVTVIVARNKEIIPADEPVHEQDTLEIISVISGG